MVPRRVRAAALRAALSAKAQTGRLIIVESLSQAQPRTKECKALLERVGAKGRVLIVADQVRRDDPVATSCRNLPDVMILHPQGLNVYDVLKHDTLIMTRGALGLVEEACRP